MKKLRLHLVNPVPLPLKLPPGMMARATAPPVTATSYPQAPWLSVVNYVGIFATWLPLAVISPRKLLVR